MKDGLLFTRLQAYRQASDYAYAFAIDLVDAEGEIEAAGAFVGRAQAAVDLYGTT